MIMVNMAKRAQFELVYAPITRDHARAIEAKHRPLIRDRIEQQLRLEPDVATHSHKPLTRPAIFGATWELRFGQGNRCRVLYRVDRAEMEVIVLAIGVKVGERLWVGGEEIVL